MFVIFFFFSSRRRHTRLTCDWSSDVCSSDLDFNFPTVGLGGAISALDSTLRPGNILNNTTSTGNYDSAFAFILGRYASVQRSEERRVGKECRSRWSP